ncbi:hypothetical protein [Noviherbaspirillum soli]|uniref:hypothetical protein n=1 Tax=Noviherbaspirillum soli TaxID=1064518 RepID=UPI00188D1A1E|nr:hypothetical protein [Noviherbaspirillum soli]
MIKNLYRDLFRTACLGFAALLCGCGGSSSGNADSANAGKDPVPLTPLRSPITATNFAYLVASSYRALESLAEVAEGIGVATADFPGALELPGMPGSDADVGNAAVPLPGLAMKLAGFQLAAGVAQKFDCEFGGSITLSGAMANQNRLTQGDEVRVVTENCRRPDGSSDVAGDLINGNMSLSVKQMSGIPGPDSVWSGVIAVRYDNLVTVSDTGTESLNGDTEVSISQSASDSQVLAATGKELRLKQQAPGRAAQELVLRDYRADIRKSGDDLSFGGNFAFSTIKLDEGTLLVGVSTGKPFTVNIEDAIPVTPPDGAPPADGIRQVDVYPSSGQMTITGADSNATLEAEKSGGLVPAFLARLAVQATRSDGSYAASQTLLWKDLLGAL